MLQKVDKDRLDAVLRVIETKNWKFPMTEIHKVMGTDKGMISKYLNGKEGMSDKFYSNFMQTFNNGEGEAKGGGSLSLGDLATLQVRSEARLTVLLEAVAEVLAGQRGLTAADVRLSLESAVKAKEADLKVELGKK